jgi:hypothetical protein
VQIWLDPGAARRIYFVDTAIITPTTKLFTFPESTAGVIEQNVGKGARASGAREDAIEEDR